MDQLIADKVKNRIFGHGRGWSFTPADFPLSVGTDTAVRQALSRLQRAGAIRRVAWGVYDYPRKHPVLGDLPPDIQQVAHAVSRKDNAKLMPSPAYAANLLGLSDQVPGRVTFLTDGPPKKVRVGNVIVIFKKTTPKNMATANTIGGLVIQALRHLGKDHIDDRVTTTLKRRLAKDDLASLRQASNFAPAWISKIMQNLWDQSRHG